MDGPGKWNETYLNQCHLCLTKLTWLDVQMCVTRGAPGYLKETQHSHTHTHTNTRLPQMDPSSSLGRAREDRGAGSSPGASHVPSSSPRPQRRRPTAAPRAAAPSRGVGGGCLLFFPFYIFRMGGLVLTCVCVFAVGGGGVMLFRCCLSLVCVCVLVGWPAGPAIFWG